MAAYCIEKSRALVFNLCVRLHLLINDENFYDFLNIVYCLKKMFSLRGNQEAAIPYACLLDSRRYYIILHKIRVL